MIRLLRVAGVVLGFTLFVTWVLSADLWAFTIVEDSHFKEGSYTFKMELQVNGRGSVKKAPFRITSLKVKIKNERASPEILRVRTVRVYTDPVVYMDIETRGFPVSPTQWVTKFYRLRKEKQPLMSAKGFIEIAFENFAVIFIPQERRFLPPVR